MVYAIEHAAHMLNQVPARLGCCLTSPFDLVYNVRHDLSAWFKIFSICYFSNSFDVGRGDLKSNLRAQYFDGIMVGEDKQSSTITFYNPLIKKLYHHQTSISMMVGCQ